MNYKYLANVLLVLAASLLVSKSNNFYDISSDKLDAVEENGNDNVRIRKGNNGVFCKYNVNNSLTIQLDELDNYQTNRYNHIFNLEELNEDKIIQKEVNYITCKVFTFYKKKILFKYNDEYYKIIDIYNNESGEENRTTTTTNNSTSSILQSTTNTSTQYRTNENKSTIITSTLSTSDISSTMDFSTTMANQSEYNSCSIQPGNDNKTTITTFTTIDNSADDIDNGDNDENNIDNSNTQTNSSNENSNTIEYINIIMGFLSTIIFLIIITIFLILCFLIKHKRRIKLYNDTIYTNNANNLNEEESEYGQL